MLQYVTMPIEILQLDLSIQEKFILSLAKTLNQGCFLSNQQIASMLGLSKSRVSHLITKLVKEGYLDITLEYKENSKEVAKRTITFIESIKTIAKKIATKTITKTIGGKNKAIKSEYMAKTDYVTKEQQVGTERVQQVMFGSNFFMPNNTYRPKKVSNVFNRTYSHNWDLDELERIDRQLLEQKYIESGE